jgi:hypothetical protein
LTVSWSPSESPSWLLPEPEAVLLLELPALPELFELAVPAELLADPLLAEPALAPPEAGVRGTGADDPSEVGREGTEAESAEGGATGKPVASAGRLEATCERLGAVSAKLAAAPATSTIATSVAIVIVLRVFVVALMA